MISPLEIRKLGDAGMKIRWSDGHESQYSPKHLRVNCHCAACRNELTGEMMFDSATIPEDLKILKADVVGNYALSFGFSDGHGTGIYSFEHLRKACSCCTGVKA